MDKVRELVCKLLDIARYFNLQNSNSIFLFFFLYLKKEHLFSYFNIHSLEFKSDILDRNTLLKDLYNEFLSIRHTRDYIMFSNEIQHNIDCIDDSYFENHYSEIIDCMLEKLFQYQACDFLQPQNVSKFINDLVNGTNAKNIYNPFAGVASYSLLSNIDSYYGQEINDQITLIAKLRLDAYGKDISTIKAEDSFGFWNPDKQSDILISTPPFGIRIPANRYDNEHAISSDEYIIGNFLKSDNLRKGILILPKSICSYDSFRNIRKYLIDNNLLDMVFELPSGIFYHTFISTVVLVLNKDRTTNDISFIDGHDCVLKENRKRLLDNKRLFDLYLKRDSKHYADVNLTEIQKNDYFLIPSRYIVDLNIKPGQIFKKLDELIELGNPLSDVTNRGLVLDPASFSDDVNLIFTEPNLSLEEIPLTYKKYQGNYIVLSFLQNKVKICKYTSKEPFYTNLRQLVFKVKASANMSIDYLIYALLQNPNFMQMASLENRAVIRVSKTYANYILGTQIIIDEDPIKQEAIINKLKDEYIAKKQKELLAEQQRLGIRTASSDLSHMLGPTFDKIANSLAYLQSMDLIDDVDETIVSISDNFNYMRRFIASVGADFTSAKMKKQEIVVNDFMKSYVDSSRNYGCSVFELEYESEITDETTIMADENLLRVMLDTLLDNAYRHGFEKIKSFENKVRIETSWTVMDDVEYVLLKVSNNGKPFSEEFSIKDYISRGKFYGETGRTGLGGNHVYSIIKRHDGFMNITSNAAWNVIFEILIPLEYSDVESDKFEYYGNAEQCI